MDFDGNGETSTMEASAYFSRNKYLLCRPYAKEMIARYSDVPQGIPEKQE